MYFIFNFRSMVREMLLCVTVIILQMGQQGLITSMLQISAKEKEGKLTKMFQLHIPKIYEISRYVRTNMNM